MSTPEKDLAEFDLLYPAKSQTVNKIWLSLIYYTQPNLICLSRQTKALYRTAN